MGHGLEASDSMVAVGQAPWHGLGVVLPEDRRLTVAEALEYANLTEPVRKVEAWAKLEDGTYVRIPETFATARGSDPLGAVGPDYKVVQDTESLGLLDVAVQDGRARWETVGRLHGGRVVWGLVRLNASFDVTGKGDEVRTYGLVTNSHDGSRRASVAFTPVRVVCHNTLQAADPGKGKLEGVRARHTSRVHERLERGARELGLIREQIATTADAYRALAGYQLTAEKLKAYVAECFPANPEAESDSKMASIRDRILQLAEEGRGMELPGVRGTLWGAYNAVTEYVDHERGIPDGATEVTARKANARLESVWFGSGATLKRSALGRALAMVRA